MNVIFYSEPRPQSSFQGLEAEQQYGVSLKPRLGNMTVVVHRVKGGITRLRYRRSSFEWFNLRDKAMRCH